MFSKVSVLVPTRKRPARLRTLLDSFEQMSTTFHAEVLFRVDNDDTDSMDLLCSHRDRRIRVVVGPRLSGYDSMPLFFNELAALAEGDVLLCGNDDMVFKTLGWDALILEESNKHPDGLFDIGVSTHNETHYPFSIVSRRAVDAMGFLWDPRIFWGDIFLRDVMAFYGRTVMVPAVEIEHDWAGFRPDEVFTQADKDIVSRIPNYWTAVHRPAVQEAIEKLRGLAR